jgi:hypothetical protein
MLILIKINQLFISKIMLQDEHLRVKLTTKWLKWPYFTAKNLKTLNVEFEEKITMMPLFLNSEIDSQKI